MKTNQVFFNIGVWGSNTCTMAVIQQNAESDHGEVIWMHESQWLASRHSHVIEHVGRRILSKQGKMLLTYRGLMYDPDVVKWEYRSGTSRRASFEAFNTKIAVITERGSKCWYCGIRKATTLDHLHPISKGGNLGLENLVPSCRECNEAKDSEDPKTWIGEDKYKEILTSISKPMSMVNYYCSEPSDKELFNIINMLFSENPSVTIVPGVVSKAVSRQQRATYMSNPKSLESLSGYQALNVAMTHPLEKINVSGENIHADLPVMIEHC